MLTQPYFDIILILFEIYLDIVLVLTDVHVREEWTTGLGRRLRSLSVRFLELTDFGLWTVVRTLVI